MKKVVIIVANTRWLGGTSFMEPIMALPILTSILNGSFDYEVIDCNGFNLSEEQTIEAIQKARPDIVLITALAILMHKQYAKAAELVKKVSKDIITVMGGVYATTSYDHVMEDHNVDYVMLGHAEDRLCQFLNAVIGKEDLSRIKGIGYRENGQVMINPMEIYIGDVKKMVRPDYSKIDLSPYIEHGFRMIRHATREIPIMTSYGCPHNCVFCSRRSISGSKVAYREVEDVIEEMRYLKEKYQVDSIQFWDDNMLADEDRAKHLFRRMISEKFNFKIRLANAAAWHLNEEMLDLMAEAGCYGLVISLESGCDRVLHQIIRKPLKKEIVPGVVKMCQERRLFIEANIVIGFPGETWNEIRESIAFAEMCNFDLLRINIATVLPQTDLYKIAKEQGCLPDDFDFYAENTYATADNSVGKITTDEFTPEELVMLRVFEWDRINFATEEKRKKYCEYIGISAGELAELRKATRQSLGTVSWFRSR